MAGKTICYCLNVNEDEIKQAISDGANSVDDIKEATGAGTACGACTKRIEKILIDSKES
ncbi:MAG: (2Fe-2S)-binding protein [Clostridium sp.]|uniref:(2Fe-2S)-binding protein n=1 Tax=Clostridium culturomicium TaxID=1499683 RepID=UPI0029073EE2|nr:(2Fe-2S)-binding protein [Clostridium sp.]MDU7082593.1 (2Fe-2S)-binding protein [Clostridium sp.]